MRETGLHYIGMDIDGTARDIVDQGERLFFASETLGVVFTLAYLVHMTPPFVMTHEVARVLKPGGLFIGTPQFLEPCFMEPDHQVSSCNEVTR